MSDGFTIHSSRRDIGAVETSEGKLCSLQRSVVFCHNDLDPRNILVKRDPTGTTAPWSVV